MSHRRVKRQVKTFNDVANKLQTASPKIVVCPVGRFEWDESKTIGSGSFGQVFIGKDRHCLKGTEVAVKVETRKEEKKRKSVPQT